MPDEGRTHYADGHSVKCGAAGMTLAVCDTAEAATHIADLMNLGVTAEEVKTLAKVATLFRGDVLNERGNNRPQTGGDRAALKVALAPFGEGT